MSPKLALSLHVKVPLTISLQWVKTAHLINYWKGEIRQKPNKGNSSAVTTLPTFHHCLSPQEYQGSSVLGQFVTRFLLRETSTQLQSLQSSLDCAMDAVHDQGCTGRRILKKPQDLPVQRLTKRPGRRIQKNMCLSPTDPYSGMLTTGTTLQRHWD